MTDRFALISGSSSDGKLGLDRRLLFAVGIGLAGLLALLAIAPVAQAKLSWPTPQDLFTATQSVFRPQVAVDSQDRATVVWESFDGSNYVVRAVRIGADGSRGTVHDLSAPSADPHGYAVLPKVAVDSQGRATVVWRRFNGSTSWIQEVRIAADGTPGIVRDLTSPGPVDYDDPEVAVDSEDRATVVWGASDGSTSRIEAMRIGSDGALGNIQALSPAGRYAFESQLAIDPQARAIVTWESPDGSHNRIQAVRIAADGTPGPIQDLSAGGEDAHDGHVAVDSQGRAAVVWHRSDGSHDIVQAVSLAADGTPGTVHDLSAPGQDANQDQVAIDSQGRATVVWVRSASIQETRIDAAGVPGTVRDISTTAQGAYDPHVTIDSRDRPVVVWSGIDGSSRIQAVRLGVDGSAETVQDVSATSANADVPAVTIDSQDRPIVAWATGGGSDTTIQSVRGAVVAPAAPVFNTTLPASPAADTSPKLIGSAPMGTSVAVYQTADCSGSPAATGDAAEFGADGLPVNVDRGSTTTFRSTATDSDGDTSACSASTITYTELTKSTPALSTTASPGVDAGGRIHDTATLAGGQIPGGHITFKLYGPDDGGCSRAPAFTDARAVDGDGAYASADFATTAAGSYRWTVEYSGDARNAGSSTSCGAPGQVIVIAPGPPSGSKPAPVLSGLVVTPRGVALTGRLVNGQCQPRTRSNRMHRPCTRPIALQITYRLDTSARVTLTLARQLPGRLAGGRCVAPGRANTAYRHCARSVAVPGALTVNGKYGMNALRFKASGLRPGSYRLTATPVAHDGRAGTAQTVRFGVTH
jgi:hypothetical protein